MDTEGPKAGVGREPKAPGTLGARIRRAVGKLKQEMARTDTPDLLARHRRQQRLSDVLLPRVAVGLRDPTSTQNLRARGKVKRRPTASAYGVSALPGDLGLTSWAFGKPTLSAGTAPGALAVSRQVCSAIGGWVLRCPRHGGLSGPAAVIQALSADVAEA